MASLQISSAIFLLFTVNFMRLLRINNQSMKKVSRPFVQNYRKTSKFLFINK